MKHSKKSVDSFLKKLLVWTIWLWHRHIYRALIICNSYETSSDDRWYLTDSSNFWIQNWKEILLSTLLTAETLSEACCLIRPKLHGGENNGNQCAGPCPTMLRNYNNHLHQMMIKWIIIGHNPQFLSTSRWKLWLGYKRQVLHADYANF